MRDQSPSPAVASPAAGALSAKDVAARAAELVAGDRQAAYGHPLDHFSQAAQLWAAILGTPISAEQVALCMATLKLSRETHRPSNDNRVDAVGYLLCLAEIRAERARRETPTI